LPLAFVPEAITRSGPCSGRSLQPGGEGRSAAFCSGQIALDPADGGHGLGTGRCGKLKPARYTGNSQRCGSRRAAAASRWMRTTVVSGAAFWADFAAGDKIYAERLREGRGLAGTGCVQVAALAEGRPLVENRLASLCVDVKLAGLEVNEQHRR